MSYLIVGLGNIGVEYSNTRHNVGFMVLDAWAQASNFSFESKRYGDVAITRFKGQKIILLKPSTYMNLSGKAVNYWLQDQKVPIENLLIIVDDLALPLGTIRMRKKGSDGGHNGLKDISYVLNREDYSRLRVGIGDNFSKGRQVDYVIGEWSDQEKQELNDVFKKCIEATKSFVAIGVDRTMNIYNTK